MHLTTMGMRTGIAVALLSVATTAVSAQSRSLGAVLRDTTLGNGLQVVVVPNPTVPLVTIQVTIRNGAFTQLTEADEGLPHILEHMLFRSYGSTGFSQAANKLEASYNGTTSDETVTYYIVVPSSKLDDGVKLLADLMRDRKFDREDLDSERLVVRGELERRASDPDFLLSVMLNRQLWGTGFTRKNTIGTIPSIVSASATRLKEMYERFYVPNNAAVVFSGDVTADAAFASSARHFIRWKRAADPHADLELPPMPPLTRNHAFTVDLDAAEITMIVRWQGPSVDTDRDATFAADVFASIVNDPVSAVQSRLVDSGLFQSLSMSYLTRAQVGPISIEATTTADQLVEASKALRAELDRFTEVGYVTAELLEIAKKRRETDWAMAMATPLGLASFVGNLWSVADLDYVRGYLPAMQKQGEADLKRFVDTYLAGKPRVMGIGVSPTTRRELGPRLDTALAPWRQ